MAKRQRFVVIVQRPNYGSDAYGPYTTFRKAEADAKAWDGINKQWTYVVPLKNTDDYKDSND